MKLAVVKEFGGPEGDIVYHGPEDNGPGSRVKTGHLTPLAGMTLQSINFTPKNITKGIEIVRGMKTVEHLSVNDAHNSEKIKRDDFWKRYGAGEFK